MKKIIISFTILFVSLIMLIFYKPLVAKYLMGNANVLSSVKAYSVTINNEIHKDILFNNINKDTFIIYLNEEKLKTDYSIITIDFKNKCVGYNCSSNKCYDTFLGYLFQSDMGIAYITFENETKGPNFKTDFKIKDEIIDFYIPKNDGSKLQVQLNLEDSCL